MDVLKNWVLSLTAGALACSLVSALAPKGKSGAALRLVCGLVTAALLLGPLRSFDFAAYAGQLAALRTEGEALSADAEETARRARLTVIGESCCAYISDKAAGLGITGLRVRVTVTEDAETGEARPYSAELGGEAADAEKAELSRWIEGELGIPRERQDWSDRDED